MTSIINTLETLARRARLKIGIDLADKPTGFVASYTTLDKIEGEVTIEADQDTRFDSVEITFEGTARTSVDAPTPGCPLDQAGAIQTFLRLRQPIDETSYPEPRVFKARRRYRFPFTFVVPAQLLPQACSHETCSLDLRLAHLQLPPSLGDPMVASDGTSLLDDLAPEMTQISYLIRVCVKKGPSDGSSSPRTLAAVAKKVRIIPASVEQPPLEIPCRSDEYCIRREKGVRRGLLRGKMGRLVMAASQPRPLQSRPPGSDSSNSTASSAVNVHLRFDPQGNELPPRLGTLTSKLKVSTFFGTTPWTEFPSRSPALVWNPSRGVYTETVPLSSLCVSSAQWERHRHDACRRSSMQSSTSSVDSAGGVYFYTASIIVPLSLPKGKAFVPTFHSCLISRVYALDLAVSYHTPNASVLSSSVSLKVPIQITSAPRKAVPDDDLLVTDLVDMMTISQMRVDEELLQPPEYSSILNSRPLPRTAATGGGGGIDHPDNGESSSPIADIPPAADQTIRSCTCC